MKNSDWAHLRERWLSLLEAPPHICRENDCDETLRFVREYIRRVGLDEAQITRWLEQNGGHCDCEALNNVEQVVSDAVPGYDELGGDPRRVN